LRQPSCIYGSKRLFYKYHKPYHFLRAGFGLKLLCDWVVFWEKGYGSGVEEHFCSMAEECRVMGFARLVTAVL